MTWFDKSRHFFALSAAALATTVVVIMTTWLPGCGVESDGFYFGTLGLNEGRIFIVNAVANPVSYTISMYDIEGKFLGIVLDTSVNNVILRGVARYDAYNLVVSTDTPDRLGLLDIFSGEFTTFAENSLFTGNIYDVVRGHDGSYFTAEGNTIERFLDGKRIPSVGAVPYVNTTLGGCTIATARGISVTAAGRLVVASNANDDVNVYDVSGVASATCVTGYQGFGATVNPIDVLGHTNGNIYIAGNGDHTIYEADGTLSGAPTAIFVNNTIISAPVALGEMPDGSLLVASDGTDSVVRIDTSGNLINAYFIKNGLTGTMADILVVHPQ